MPLKHEAAVLGVTQGLQAFQAAAMLNPSIGTIRRGTWGTDDQVRKDTRDGERIAAVLTIGTGIVLAVLIEDMTPLWTSLLAAATMVAIYEWALATRAPNHTTSEAEAG